MTAMKHYPSPQEFFASPGLLTDAGKYAPLLKELPDDIGELCKIVQGLILHIFWASRYGLELTEERKAEVNLRSMTAKLDRIFELDGRPLVEPRNLNRKLVGNCRDISVFLTSILQHKGIPARARCGFGTYFIPNHFEDHWVCEYWDKSQNRWVMVDAQLDQLQRERLGIQFNTLDMPDGAFVTGGQAWKMCRTGNADPDLFGIFEFKGMAFIAGDLIRDFLALNKIEILPWDNWGYMSWPEVAPSDLGMLDKIASLTLGGDTVFDEVRTQFEDDPLLHPAADWKP